MRTNILNGEGNKDELYEVDFIDSQLKNIVKQMISIQSNAE